MFGVEINFKSGDKDWIDPVVDDPVEADGKLIVENNYNSYTYDFDLELVNRWFKYDLCEKCEHDVRSYGCETGCVKP